MGAEIDLGAALDTVVASLKTQFPTFRTVAAEDESRKKLEVPALIIQFSEIEPLPDADPHTGQFPCLIRVEARIILGHRTPKVRREIIKAAGAIATFVHNNRLGVLWGAGVVIAVEPDEFAPHAETFDVWRVEWAHATVLGASYFVDEGITPTKILTSWSPQTGAGNEGSYTSEDL